MAYRFDGLVNFKVGERYWECSQYGEYQFEVVTAPEVTRGKSGRNQVTFLVRSVETGQELEMLMTEGYEHYGPRIYNHRMYTHAPIVFHDQATP